MRQILPNECSQYILALPIVSNTYAAKLEHAWIESRRKEIELLHWPSERLKDYSWLVGRVINDATSVQNRICHIIGSGSTVINSYKSIDSSDFVIGFNFASLLPLRYNVYFIEGCISGDSRLARVSLLLKQCIRCNIPDLLVCKNLSIKQYDMNSVYAIYNEAPIAVPDVILPWRLNRLARLLNRNFLANRLLYADPVYIRQMRSTIFTCIALAIHSGFQTIVVHGLDMGGPHFYANSSVTWPETANRNDISELIKASDGHHKYSSRYADILYGLKAIANSKGIRLIAGSTASKSAEILGSLAKH